jgi:iron complex transport system substrate-binding protein
MTRRLPLLAVLAAALLLPLACGGDGTASRAGGVDPSGGAFPVRIRHAFGTTTVAAAPARVVTWGWASADAAIAVGVAPVAIPYEEYGGDGDGVLPWIRERLGRDRERLPAVLPNTEEVPFEAIARARPDLILAPYSGISEAEYRTLSDIAPTVAYPGEAWATPWRRTIEIVGRALGREARARSVLATIDRKIADAAAAHPELAGVSVANVWDNAGTFYVYKQADPRVGFTLDLGTKLAPSVASLEGDDAETFYFTLSHERLGELSSDLLVAYADTAEDARRFLDSAPARLMDQVRGGDVAVLVGPARIASVSPPTALSLPWGLDEYVTTLSRVVRDGGPVLSSTVAPARS